MIPMTFRTRVTWTSLALAIGAVVAFGSTGRAADEAQKAAKAKAKQALIEAQKKAAAEAAKKPAPKTAADAKKPAEVAKKPAPANAVAAEAKKPATLPAKLEAPALSQMIDSAITRQL